MNFANLALNFQLDASGQLPNWLPLVPAGRFQGRDGRWWINDRPDDIIAALNSEGREIPWDCEHATELKAPKGEPAPACAFTGKLENRDGFIWGAVEWNSEGEKLVGGKQYKYYSPAFRFDRDSRRVLSLSSIGLTNKHNLPELPALNSQTTEESVMKLPLAIAMALALNAEAQ
jgi:phage I-like protein